MGNVNKVFLMGNMTRDPELRYTPSGTPVCDFGMAINRNYTTQSGEKREETCFVDVTFWARRGEVISEYFGKGDQIFIEGRLQLDQWETPEGRRSKLKVVGFDFQFCGRTSGGNGGGGGRGGGGGYQQGGQRGGGGRQGYQSQGGGAPQGGGASQGGQRQSRQNQGGGASQGAQPQGQQDQGGGGGGSADQSAQEPEDAGYDVSDDEIPF